MLKESEADELIAAASRMSARQLSDLAEATRKAVGSGIKAHLGLSGRQRTAIDAAGKAGEEAGRGEIMEAKSRQLADAVLQAAVGAAIQMGRDAAVVRPAWEEFKVATDSGDSHRKRITFRASRKAFRRGLGRPLDRQWLMATTGASWALAAVVTWDLVGEHGPYLRQHRDTLTGPWRSVAPLPASCD